MPASMMRSFSLRRRCATASARASAVPVADLALVDRDVPVDRVLREPAARVDFAREPDALVVERLDWLRPEVLFVPEVLFAPEVLREREVDLAPPLLACGISPSGN